MFSHRPVTSDDFNVISEFPQDAKELFFMYPKGKYPITANQLEEVASNRINPTVITHDRLVVGYCNLYDVSAEECWLGNVIIAPSYRGRGVGKYLIETMKVYAKTELKVSFFRLICHNINTKALLFYTKLGFKPFGLKIINDHEGNDIVGIKMEIEI